MSIRTLPVAIPQDASITHLYPFAAGFAVASRVGSGGDPDLMYPAAEESG